MDEINSSKTPIGPAQPLVDDKTSTPKWVMITGAWFFGGTLLFFMLLVVASVLRFEVPSGARFLVIIVLALGAAGSFGFLGGAAAASGNIPIPGVQRNVIAFSTAGGIAVLVIFLSLGYYLYVRQANDQFNHLVLTLPSDISRDFTVENISPKAIEDVGEVRTIAGRQLLYVHFIPGQTSGRIRFSFLKENVLEFQHIVYEVTTNGELTKKSEGL